MPNVYGYARTAHSDARRFMEFQLQDIKRYCDEHGLTLTEVYTDVGSGLTRLIERSGARNLVTTVKGGDTVIVTDLARLSRNCDHLLEYAANMRESGVNLIIIEDPELKL